ncbi:alpha/beta hydrolase fold domain-containing protein [uncultured Microscilla sp.]|uniref:alpha/beta hydrolase fold domain-containing protein n=1 Tax=uncultured Microscilla sp. TaxID=432653 RepID=UPI002637E9C0|nr:alpha/beta hydrolase fold domain-containing protein [uncultured Microscilla sp.]
MKNDVSNSIYAQLAQQFQALSKKEETPTVEDMKEFMNSFEKAADQVKIDRCYEHCTVGKHSLFYKQAEVFNLRKDKDKAKITVGDNTHIKGELLIFQYGGEIHIGDNTYIGMGTNITSGESIKIGNNVLIAYNVNVIDSNAHETDYLERRASFKGPLLDNEDSIAQKSTIETAPIVIEDDAWINFNAIVMKGVTIGRGAIIGAGAIVTKDVPPFSVVLGEPANVHSFLPTKVDTEFLKRVRHSLAFIEKNNPSLKGTTITKHQHKENCHLIKTENTTKEKIIFYLHGGGYIQGGIDDYLGVVSRIADVSKTELFFVDYPLAPEHPFPAGLNDVLNTYKIVAQKYADRSIIIMGDSAGGGLALALLQKVRSEQLPMPKAVVLLSPWLDLNCNSKAYKTLKEKDKLLTQDALWKAAAMYLQGGGSPNNPLVSPLFANFKGFPPMLIHVGTHELLLSENRRLAKKASVDGVNVHLEEWEGMQHFWYGFEPKAPQSESGLTQIKDFIDLY